MPLFSGGHAPVVQQLLELPQGTINFSAVNNRGKTGMDVAKEKRHTAIVNLLTTAGLGTGPKVLFLDACKNQTQISDELRKTLLERGDIVKSCGAKKFRGACRNGKEVTVKWFLQECQGLLDYNKPDSHNSTPFHFACYEGGEAVVNLLLQQPQGVIDITSKDNDGDNGFICACLGICQFFIFTKD